MSRQATASLRALGERIGNLRDVRGWSQDDLAARSGIDLADVVEIERGDRDPTLGTLERLAGCLGVTIGEIACGTERL